MTEQTRRAVNENVRYGAVWIGELAFAIASMGAVLVIAVLVIGGINPLTSAALIVFLLVAGALVGAHRAWYTRHREEIEHGPELHSARERRGF